MAEMRITGGELRGRRLYVPKAGMRPTTGRVREAIFSMLGSIEGVLVLDLFCGSGALGIEALSRGAADATFVDRNAGPVTRNLDQLGITGGEPDRGWVVREDAFDFLERETFFGPTLRYDLILCDPPYRLAAALVTGLDIFIPGVLAEGGRLVLETSARNPIELSYPLIKDRSYGDTLVRIYAPEPVPHTKEQK
jgi:16S rRNA (guanine966-N2)-methyltransferase